MKYKGHNITETVILIALVAIAAIGILTFLGQNIDGLFGTSSTKIKGFQPFGKSTENSTIPVKTGIKPGDLGGQPKIPVSKCDEGSCVIDYGEFILTGIPEDFTEYVNSGGSSGGTDKLMAILTQMADQLEQQGKTADAKLLKELATIGGFMGYNFKLIENEAINNINDPSRDFGYFMDIDNFKNNVTISDEVKALLPNVNELYNGLEVMSPLGIGSVGDARYIKNLFPSNFSDSLSMVPASAFVNKLDEVLASPNISGQMKGIAREISFYMNDIQYNMSHKYIYNDASAIGDQLQIQDPITGNVTKEIDLDYDKLNKMTQEEKLNGIIHPDFSEELNLKMSLLCNANWNISTGLSCH